MDMKLCFWIILCIHCCYGYEAEILSTNSIVYAIEDRALNLTCKINRTKTYDIIAFFKNEQTGSNDLLVYDGTMCYPETHFTCDHTNQLFTYTLEAGSFLNGDYWRCRTDKNGIISEKVTLTVVETFSSITMTEPVGNITTIDVNLSAEFKCETSLGRPDAEIRWYKRLVNGTEIQLLNRSSSQVMHNGSKSWTKSTLQYTAIESENGANIWCEGLLSQVLNNIPQKSREKQLNIRYPPTKEPQTNNDGHLTVVEGSNIEIRCNITGGNPLSSLSWKCNEQNVTGNDTITGPTFLSQLSILAISTYNGKSCYCIASHPLWVAKLIETKLNIQFSPLQNITVTSSYIGHINASSNVTLQCEVHGGNPVANATWQCDDKDIISATNELNDKAITTTTFQVEKRDNRRTCTCKATHFLWKQGIQKNITLNVYFAPETDLKITGATNETIFYENDSVNLSCYLGNGNPLAKLVFTCWSLETGINTNTSNAAVSVISAKAMRLYNKKTCKCTAEHILLPNTLEYVLQTIVYYPPMNTTLKFSPSLPLLEGQEVNVSCNAVDGNPNISSYNWVLNSKLLETNSKIFKFKNITKETNQQSLECRVHNAFTDVKGLVVQSSNYTIHVHYRPRIVQFEKMLVTEEGMTVNTSCLAVGNPDPTVQWFHENNSITKEYMKKSDLNLLDINRTQQGDYYCISHANSPQHGLLESRAVVRIIVNYPPDISVLVEGTNLSVNTSVRLFCNASGQPSKYTFSGWRHSFHEKDIRQTDKLQTYGNGSYIVLSNLSYQDVGTYACFVDNGIKNRNDVLMQTGSTFIAVNGPPIKIPENPFVPIFTAEQRSLLKAKLHIFAFPNITNLRWYNLTSGNAPSNIIVSTNFSKTTLKYKLYGVEVDVNKFAYEFIFMIENFQHSHEGSYLLMVSNSDRSTNFTFRAQISGPPETPSFLNISEKTDSEITLYLISGFNGGHDQRFHVLYHEARHDELIYELSFIDSNKQPQLLRVTDLKASTRYMFSVYASNEKGNSTLNETMCCRFVEVQTHAKSENPRGEQTLPVSGIAAGLASAVTIVIIVTVIVIFVRRRMSFFSKGKHNNERLKLGSSDKDVEGNDGLHDNILYESAGPEFGIKTASTVVEYAMVQKKSDKLIVKEEQNLQETGIYSEVKKKSKVKKKVDVYTNISGAKIGKDQDADRNKQNGSEIEDVYQNMSNGMKTNPKDNLVKSNKNKDGLYYAELVFNPVPNGAKFVIHGNDDRTIYAEVDTTQKIDPLPDSDEEDDEARSNPGKEDT